MVRQLALGSILALSALLGGCFTLSTDPLYQGPPARPHELIKYYAVTTPYLGFHEEIVRQEKEFTVRRICLETKSGDVTVDYFAGKEANPNLILVFPLLGGKNIVVDYFAEYFVRNGYDAAIVHRSDDFKDPSNVDRLEEVLRQNVVRDRLTMDFFEEQYGKKAFGSFGISRGAINVVMTAGADPRLRYNVIAMGASDLARILRVTNEKKIRRYVTNLVASSKMSEEQFYDYVRDSIRTDPKNLAQYIDARHTLLFLALLDKTVPIQYGNKLRRQIGHPKTIYLTADHYLSVLYTGLPANVSTGTTDPIFPFNYIESEALSFYDQNFKGKREGADMLPLRVIQAPFNLVARLVDWLF